MICHWNPPLYSEVLWLQMCQQQNYFSGRLPKFARRCLFRCADRLLKIVACIYIYIYTIIYIYRTYIHDYTSIILDGTACHGCCTRNGWPVFAHLSTVSWDLLGPWQVRSVGNGCCWAWGSALRVKQRAAQILPWQQHVQLMCRYCSIFSEFQYWKKRGGESWQWPWRPCVVTIRNFRLATWDPMNPNGPRMSKISNEVFNVSKVSKRLVVTSW